MLRHMLLGIVLSAATLSVAASPVFAQATRTWVSGLGNDANPCSRTAPCKTFAGAISKTVAGGEIDALDPGGFGALTITKSITIDGGGGQVASVLVGGTNGIVVNAGAGTVILRNLRINGVAGTPSPGLNGIRFLAGAALHIENCTIFGFTQNGIDISLNTASPAQVFVTDTVVSDSAGGIAAKNAGSGNVFVSVQRTSLTKNSSFGLRADGTSGTAQLIGAAVSHSLIAGNGVGLSAFGGTSGSSIEVTYSSIAHNVGAGAQANGTSGLATIIFANTLVTGNATGLSSVAGGNLLSYKNNSVNGNFVDGAFTGTFVPE